MANTRKIGLVDGTCMGDLLTIFETNAPKEELKALEKISCDAYISGNGDDDVPIWAEKLFEKGYKFEYIADHQHVSPYDTSSSWQKKNYPDIKEFYIIDNQPDLKGTNRAWLKKKN